MKNQHEKGLPELIGEKMAADPRLSYSQAIKLVASENRALVERYRDEHLGDRRQADSEGNSGFPLAIPSSRGRRTGEMRVLTGGGWKLMASENMGQPNTTDVVGTLRDVGRRGLEVETSPGTLAWVHTMKDTTFVRDGVAVHSGELKMGDRVRIQAIRDEDGLLSAVSITILGNGGKTVAGEARFSDLSKIDDYLHQESLRTMKEEELEYTAAFRQVTRRNPELIRQRTALQHKEMNGSSAMKTYNIANDRLVETGDDLASTEALLLATVDEKLKAQPGLQYHEALKLVASEHPELNMRYTRLNRRKMRDDED